MATNYISTRSGPWSEAATWGGGGAPTSAGDTATVTAGHEVVYDLDSAVELGAITVYGVLSVARDRNTKLVQGDNSITVKSGGELRVGAEAALVPKDYTCDLLWNTTTDNANGIAVEAGGKLAVWGDPGYYGGAHTAVIAADWTSGQTFAVAGDWTAKWKVGQEITVGKGGTYGHYNTDTALFTIKALTLSGGDTAIEITEAKPAGTFLTGGAVTNVSRNVKIGKLGASTVIGNYNTLRPRILNSSTAGVVIRDATLTGLARGLDGGSGAVIDGVIRNCQWGVIYGSGHTVSGAVYSCQYGVGYGSGHTVSGAVYSCQWGVVHGSGHTVSGAVYSCQYGVVFGSGHTVSGAVYSCKYGVYSGERVVVTGALGYDAAGSPSPNSGADIECYSWVIQTDVILRGARYAPAGLTFASRNNRLYYSDVHSFDDGQTPGVMRRYGEFGTVVNDSTAHRLATQSLRAEPLSQCGIGYGIELCRWREDNVPAGPQTRRVYVRGAGWTTFPSAAELAIEAEYLSSAGVYAVTTIRSTESLAANDVWTALTLAFSPARQGPVTYRVVLSRYEAGASVYLDHALYLSDTSFFEAAFDADGRSTLPSPCRPATLPVPGDVLAGRTYGWSSEEQRGTLALSDFDLALSVDPAENILVEVS
jgi:hypothetical protein